MEVYSNYCKELDPFSKDFDPERALRKLDFSGPSSSSVDDFEQELMDAEEAEGLIENLKEIEAAETAKARPVIGDRTRRQMVKRKVLQTRYEEVFRRTGVEYFDGVGFALAHGGLFERLRKWVKNQTRVTIKLQANSPKMQPNRCIQAIIAAYDKHWNLLVRDCDEVYLPVRRFGYAQTRENVMPPNRQYTRVGDTNILSRYSKCTIIMGRTIACIYDEQE